MGSSSHLLLLNESVELVETYDQLIARQMAGNEVFHFPLDEESGTTMTNLFGTGDGTHSGAAATPSAGFDGGYARFFDGINDYSDLVPANAWAALFDGAEGSIAAWAKVFNAGVWTNGVINRIVTIEVGITNDYIYIWKNSSSNNLQIQFRVASTSIHSVSHTMSTTEWFHVAIAWTDNGNYSRMFINGSQVGSDLDNAAAWAAPPSGVRNTIGAFSTAAVQPWHGYERNVACCKVALTDAQILAQYNNGIGA